MSWKFRVYVSQTGRSDVQNAINRLTLEGVTAFQVAVKYLAIMPITEWHEPKAKKLKGYRELYEIRFKADRKQHRPIGYFGPGKDEFTILIYATHKQDIYDPSSALDSAEFRRKEIAGAKARTSPLEIDGENFPPDGE